MDENIDIYADLDEEELKDSENELKIDDDDLLETEALKPTIVKEIEIQKSKDCEELLKSIEAIREKLKVAETINQTLRKNCSLILTTCKTELQRKDKMVSNLRKELDAYLFKKKVPVSNVKKISQSTQTQNVVFNVAVQTTTTSRSDQSNTIFSKMNGSRKDQFLKDKEKSRRRYDDDRSHRFSSRFSRRSRSRERSKSVSPVKPGTVDRTYSIRSKSTRSRDSTEHKLQELNKSKMNVASKPEEMRRSQRIEIHKTDRKVINGKDSNEPQKRQSNETNPIIPVRDLRSKINNLKKSTQDEVVNKESVIMKEAELKIKKCDEICLQTEKTSTEQESEQQVGANPVLEKESVVKNEVIDDTEKIPMEKLKITEKVDEQPLKSDPVSVNQSIVENENTDTPDNAEEEHEQQVETKSTSENQSVAESVKIEKAPIEKSKDSEKELEQQLETKHLENQDKTSVVEPEATEKIDNQPVDIKPGSEDQLKVPEKTPDKVPNEISTIANPEANVPETPIILNDTLERNLQDIHEVPVPDVQKVIHVKEKDLKDKKVTEIMRKTSEKVLQSFYGKSKMSFTIPKKVKQPEIEKKDTQSNRKKDRNLEKVCDKKDDRFLGYQEKDSKKDFNNKKSKRGREDDYCEDVEHKKRSRREEPEKKSKASEKSRESSRKRKKEDEKSSRSKVLKSEEDNFVQDDTEDLELKLRQQEEILKQLEQLDQEDEELNPREKQDSKETILLDDGSANMEAPSIHTIMEAPCSIVEPSYEPQNNSFLDIFNLSMTPDKAAELSGKQETPMKSNKALNFNGINIDKKSNEIMEIDVGQENPDPVQQNAKNSQTVENIETNKVTVDSLEVKSDENAKPTATTSSNSILNEIFSAISEAARTPKKSKKDKKKKKKEQDKLELETAKNISTEKICKEVPVEPQKADPEVKNESCDTSKENLNDSNSVRIWENKYKEYHEEIVDGEVVVCIKKKKKSKKHKKDKKNISIK